MLSQAKLRAAVGAAGIPAEPRWEAEIDSTNRLAREMAEAGAPAWTVVATGHQTAGRGRLGRGWTDRPGAALLFSVVLRPPADVTPDRAGLLTLGAGVAAAEACRAVSDHDVRCKWPNDLLVGDGKVGGILAESRVDRGALAHAVVGVGINLVAPEGVDGAAGLGQVDEGRLLELLLVRFRSLVDAEPAGGDVLGAYRPLCVTIGLEVRATTVDGRSVEGVATGVADDGNLLISTAGGPPAQVAFGEVVHLRGG